MRFSSIFLTKALAVVGMMAFGVAAPQAAHAQLLASHSYELNGSLADTNGGPSLVSYGGTVGPTAYTFGEGQGLSLSNAISPSTYSIEMLFSATDIISYRSLINFKNLTSDNGLYIYSGNLIFYNGGIVATGSAGIAANTPTHLVLTRDNSSSLLTGYINGIQQFAYADTGGQGIFNATNNIGYFFRDNSSENTAGSVDYIRVYDTALNGQQVATLAGVTATAAPEPGSCALVAVTLLPIAAGVVRRRKRACAF